MISGPPANFDNPMFAGDRTIRIAFIESELRPITTVSKILGGKFGTDQHTDAYLRSQGEDAKAISSCLLSRDFSVCRYDVIIVRAYIVDRPFDCLGLFRLDYDPRDMLEQSGYIPVFVSSSTVAYVVGK